MPRLAVLWWQTVPPTWCLPAPPGAPESGIARQLRLLRRVARIVPLADALERMRRGRPLPRRAVAVTFDDGYRDNLDVAVPLLRRLGVPATFCLVPGLLSREVRPWWETLAWAVTHTERPALEWDDRRFPLTGDADRGAAVSALAEGLKGLDRVGRDRRLDRLVADLEPAGDPGFDSMFLDWDGACRLAATGADIGSHSSFHTILSRETAEAQRLDLARSRADLQDGLDVPVDVLAYPNGRRVDYDAATVAAAEAAGFRAALTTVNGWNDPDTPPFEIRRFVIEPEAGVRGLRPLLRGALGFSG